MGHLKDHKEFYESFTDVELVQKLRKSHHLLVIRQCKDWLCDIFNKKFHTDLFDDNRLNDDGNKLRTFRIFKSEITLESYLYNIENRKVRAFFTKLRISAHTLPIEVGRHRRPKKVPINERTCDTCNSGMVGDERHLICICSTMKSHRNELYKEIAKFNQDFTELDDMEKFSYIMKCDNSDFVGPLSKFLQEIMSIRDTLHPKPKKK